LLRGGYALFLFGPTCPMHSPEERRAPKLRQRSNGSLYADFYAPERSPTRKRVALGVVLDEELNEPAEEAPASVVSRFYDEYHDPYLRGSYDPWEPQEKRERVSLNEALDRYIHREGITDNTRRTVRVTLREFESDYVEGSPMVAGVTEADVKGYVYRGDLSDSYQKSLYSRLHAFFQWAQDEDLIDPGDNPMEGLTKPRVRDKTKSYLQPDEWTALVEQIEDEYREKVGRDGRKGIKKNELIWILPILKFGTATGMRPTEIKNLRVQDIDLETGRIHAPALEGNKGRGRMVPMCILAEEIALDAMENKQPTDYLFSGSRSETFCTRTLSRNVKQRIKDADGVSDDADLYTATRHTFASWVAMLGYDIGTICKVMGHSSTNVTEGYMHVGPGMLDRNMSERYRKFADKVGELGFFDHAFGQGLKAAR
jgi:integrase